MTFSLIARDPRTRAVGLIVASKFFACGALVPFVGRDVAVASQAFCNPLWGTEGRARLLEGEKAATVLADLVARDEGRAIRQAHLTDRHGTFAAHTGADCVDWAGHLIAADHSVAGNMLAGPAVIEAVSRTFAATDAPFPERLIAAMQAGEAAGGDKRGRQAAGLVIHRGEDHAWLDLRADDDAAPLDELHRLWQVARERYVPFAAAMATRDNFSGTTTREGIDAGIAADIERRRAEGRPGASRAHETGL